MYQFLRPAPRGARLRVSCGYLSNSAALLGCARLSGVTEMVEVAIAHFGRGRDDYILQGEFGVERDSYFTLLYFH